MTHIRQKPLFHIILTIFPHLVFALRTFTFLTFAIAIRQHFFLKFPFSFVFSFRLLLYRELYRSMIPHSQQNQKFVAYFIVRWYGVCVRFWCSIDCSIVFKQFVLLWLSRCFHPFGASKINSFLCQDKDFAVRFRCSAIF